jgi:hypothetical protein
MRVVRNEEKKEKKEKKVKKKAKNHFQLTSPTSTFLTLPFQLCDR